jgi:subtilisin family serine protease
MDTQRSDRPFAILSANEKILQLDSAAVPPLGGGIRLIGPQTAMVPNEDFAAVAKPEGDGTPPFAHTVFDNSTIFFPLVPEMVGAAMVDNDENWGAGAAGIRAAPFFQRGIAGQGVRIGLADSGMDSTHPVFANLVAEGRLVGFAHFDKLGAKVVQKKPGGVAVPDAKATPTFGHWHGTHCAGILVGQSTSGKVHGVAPRAELAVVRVLEEANEGSPAGILAGLWWLTTQDCDIVSVSLGWPGLHEVWWEPIAALLQKGVVVVAAVGNERLTAGAKPSRSPANYLATPGNSAEGRLLAVGAHNASGVVWDESGGELVDWSKERVLLSNGATRPSVFASVAPRVVPALVAPGVDIVSSSPPDGAYRSSAGSSMAAPHAAGLIALVLSELRTRDATTSPRLAADLLLSCLTDIAPAGTDTESGDGRVDNDALAQKLAAIMAA